MKTRSRIVVGLALLAGAGLGMGPVNCSGYVAHLSGSQEVDPVDTTASGQALFMYSEVEAPSASIPDGVPPQGPLAGRAPIQIDYKLVLSATAATDSGEPGQLLMAHIHCAPEGENGPVAVTLFDAQGVGVETPTQVQGHITEADIGPNDCGITTLQDLVDAMDSGDTYVNVHTNAHPDGEIRGQIRGLSPSLP